MVDQRPRRLPAWRFQGVLALPNSGLLLLNAQAYTHHAIPPFLAFTVDHLELALLNLLQLIRMLLCKRCMTVPRYVYWHSIMCWCAHGERASCPNALPCTLPTRLCYSFCTQTFHKNMEEQFRASIGADEHKFEQREFQLQVDALKARHARMAELRDDMISGVILARAKAAKLQTNHMRQNHYRTLSAQQQAVASRVQFLRSQHVLGAERRRAARLKEARRANQLHELRANDLSRQVRLQIKSMSSAQQVTYNAVRGQQLRQLTALHRLEQHHKLVLHATTDDQERAQTELELQMMEARAQLEAQHAEAMLRLQVEHSSARLKLETEQSRAAAAHEASVLEQQHELALRTLAQHWEQQQRRRRRRFRRDQKRREQAAQADDNSEDAMYAQDLDAGAVERVFYEVADGGSDITAGSNASSFLGPLGMAARASVGASSAGGSAAHRARYGTHVEQDEDSASTGTAPDTGTQAAAAAAGTEPARSVAATVPMGRASSILSGSTLTGGSAGLSLGGTASGTALAGGTAVAMRTTKAVRAQLEAVNEEFAAAEEKGELHDDDRRAWARNQANLQALNDQAERSAEAQRAATAAAQTATQNLLAAQMIEIDALQTSQQEAMQKLAKRYLQEEKRLLLQHTRERQALQAQHDSTKETLLAQHESELADILMLSPVAVTGQEDRGSAQQGATPSTPTHLESLARKDMVSAVSAVAPGGTFPTVSTDNPEHPGAGSTTAMSTEPRRRQRPPAAATSSTPLSGAPGSTASGDMSMPTDALLNDSGIQPVPDDVATRAASGSTLLTMTEMRALLPSQVKVLVAEDSTALQRLYKVLLRRKLKLDLEIVPNGEAALHALKNAADDGEPFDIALLDVNMPRMQGDDAMAAARAAGVCTPVVMVTANAMEHQKDTYKRKGAADVLSKPWSPQQLVLTMARLLRGDDDDEEGPAGSPSEPTSAGTSKAMGSVHGVPVAPSFP